MKNNIIPFDYKGSSVRVINGEDGQPWFVVKDVCDFFGVTNRNRVMQHVDAEDKGGTQMTTPGGTQEIATINESGLYTLLFHITPTRARGISEEEIEQKAAVVRNFRRWVTHEVLPAIRKHGGYLTVQKMEEALLNPDVLIRLATDLKTEREKVAVLEAAREADKPKVLFADAVASSHTSILVGQLAKILTQNGYTIGQNRLFKWLRENGYLSRRKGSDWNMPKQDYVKAGLFAIKQSTSQQPDGTVRITKTPKITGKGQQFFIDLFLGSEAMAA